jgi:DNA-binding NarL/FixJ family response regulator
LIPDPGSLRGMLRSFWRRFLTDLGLLRSSQRAYQYDAEFLETVRGLAIREQRSEAEVTAELLSLALEQKEANAVKMNCWRSLSDREQYVTALTCLGYTNHQIAARLGIAPSTVATHVRNALYKFDLHSKAELRLALSGWDFSAWEATR